MINKNDKTLHNKFFLKKDEEEEEELIEDSKLMWVRIVARANIARVIRTLLNVTQQHARARNASARIQRTLHMYYLVRGRYIPAACSRHRLD